MTRPIISLWTTTAYNMLLTYNDQDDFNNLRIAYGAVTDNHDLNADLQKYLSSSSYNDLRTAGIL